MPVTYNDEALKAQGIAAYTFALYRKQFSDKEYDITADYTVDQTFLTDEEQQEKWGSSYSENKEKLKQIAECIKGKWLSFDGKPALTVYHAVSCGVTYSAKDVWGKDVSYLKSVDSSFDKKSKDYSNVFEISKNDFYKMTGLKEKDEMPKIKTNKDKNGRIKSMSIDGKEFDTSKFVKTFGLKSQNFDIEINNSDLIMKITTFGYGHGVGMSQYGANSLAESGSKYKEILHHYYAGCSIEG